MARVLGDRYELGTRLAVGGMAEVYEAHDLRLGRRVAIKILRTDLADDSARARFEREARLLANLDHPDAVTLFDVGEDGPRPYLVMELVDGRNLGEHLADVGRLDGAAAVAVMDPVLRSLAAAHARGILHRDVKPGNILLGDDGRVRLADFGIAKVVADATSGLTVPGLVIGTPRYLAPEQLRGDVATVRSDVFSAVVVLYEMLAGEPPFPDDVLRSPASQLHVDAPSLSARRPDGDPRLAAVAHRALALDPAHRFAGAEEMRRALLDAVRPAPVVPPTTAMPPTNLMRPAATAAAAPTPRRAPSSRRTAVIAAVAVAAIVPAAVVVLLTREHGDGGGAADASVVPTTVAATTTIAVTTAAPTTVSRTTTTVAPTTTTTVPPTTTTVPATTTTVKATTTTTARATTTTTVFPTTVDGLVRLLTPSPDAVGDRGSDLLPQLEAIAAINPRKAGGRDLRQAVDAALVDIARWRKDGGLHEDFADRATAILQSLTA